MTMLSFLTRLMLLFLLLITLPARAADLYQVEVLVFETGALRGWTEEFWPRVEQDAPGSPWVLDDILGGHLPSMAPAWMKQIRRGSNGLLRPALQKLTPAKGYRVVLHQSWIQPLLPPSQAKPLEVFGRSSVGSTLRGTVKLYRRRYAHLRLNLDLERRIPSAVRERFIQHQNLSADEVPDHWRFQLKESRKMRSGEWHYFDHPLFGILAVIRKL